MSYFEQVYMTMKDGTIKQRNPFTGTEVWYVPGRGARPKPAINLNQRVEINNKTDNEKCIFCYNNYMKTTPEKNRLIYENGEYKNIKNMPVENIFDIEAVFRRVANLFEIVTYEYWEKNYNYKLSNEDKIWKDKYLSTEKGKEHTKLVLKEKLKRSGLSEKDIEEKLNNDESLSELANPLFGGCHELIIPQRHYKEGATYSTDLCSSGELTPEEHYQYYKFTVDAVKNILKNNRYARYVTVFQNWQTSAGASIEHLHRQLVGLDEWGTAIEREVDALRTNRNLYNEYGPNFAVFHNLLIAENDYAVAFADYGHRYPTIAIYSKSVNSRPWEHTQEELRGISDIVHSIHSSMGADVACNEEWYYTPIDAIDVMPWHILIKWRIITSAGFEGASKIYINPISPMQIKDEIIENLHKLKNENKIGNVKILDEYKIEYNKLQYYKSKI